MPHIKDIDERDAGSAGHETPAPDDLMLVDLLYGELDETARERAEQRVREDQALGQDLDAFSNLRALMRELPEADPPEALSAKLLHAAAAEVSRNRAAVEDGDEPKSLWGRLKSLFLPIAMHPAFAAAASVTLVAGIAGVLYVSGDLKSEAPRVDTTAQVQGDVAAGAPPPAAEGAASPVAAPAPVETATSADPAAIRDERDGLAEGLAKGARRGRSVDNVTAERAAEPTPEPATGAYAVDNGAEEQSLGRFAQAPEDADEAPVEEALGGRGGYLAADKDSPRVASRRPASEPPATKEEARAKKSGKLDLADSFGGDAEKVARSTNAGPTGSSAAPGSGPGATQGASAGGGGAAAPQKQKQAPAPAKPTAPPPPAAPSPAQTTPAPPPADERAQAESDDAAAPADRKAPARAEEKKPERRDAATTRVREMHEKALAAAARGDCATVRSTGTAIRQLDPTYHRDSFARDTRLQECLSAAVKKK